MLSQRVALLPHFFTCFALLFSTIPLVRSRFRERCCLFFLLSFIFLLFCMYFFHIAQMTIRCSSPQRHRLTVMRRPSDDVEHLEGRRQQSILVSVERLVGRSGRKEDVATDGWRPLIDAVAFAHTLDVRGEGEQIGITNGQDISID